MKHWTRYAPGLITLLMAVWALTPERSRLPTGIRPQLAGEFPVLLNGRVQPLDSVARNTLLQIRNKQTVLVDGKSMPASAWLLELMSNPGVADERKVFRIDNPELLALLKLPEDEKHFSFDQLNPSLGELEKQARRVDAIPDARRTAFEKQTMKLYHAVYLYHRLRHSLRPEETTNYVAELRAYEEAIPPGAEAVKAREAGKDYDAASFDRILKYASRYEAVARSAYPLMVPPPDPGRNPDAWENVGTSLLHSLQEGSVHPAVKAFAAMSDAYRAGDAAGFDQAAGEYRRWLSTALPGEQSKAAHELWFNRLQLFYKATAIYVLAFLLACISWFKMTEWVRRSALGLVMLAFVIHSVGLVYRMMLEGRPPVTNLYSSAVFIGWGAALLGMLLEKFARNGLGSMVSAGVGFTTLIIAHNLAVGGDTMEMMRAVLDSNFWLATHVVTITIGYSTNFVAGFLGILLILRGVLSRSLTAAAAESMNRMIYGMICFATFFSFVGTILGGIWADQSWGRFWGWDPKENGALIIVLWNAVILHARWGALVRERGMAIMAVFGNIVTSFSWFGVNMLGVGLHSYGFMDAAFLWLALFIASQAVVIGLGSLPLSYWRSFRLMSAPLACEPARAPRRGRAEAPAS